MKAPFRGSSILPQKLLSFTVNYCNIQGWEFLFLGANIDAVETASQFGIGSDRAVNYQCDSEGTALNYEVVSEAISSVRCSAPLNADWKKRIDEDYKKRGGK